MTIKGGLADRLVEVTVTDIFIEAEVLGGRRSVN